MFSNCGNSFYLIHVNLPEFESESKVLYCALAAMARQRMAQALSTMVPWMILLLVEDILIAISGPCLSYAS